MKESKPAARVDVSDFDLVALLRLGRDLRAATRDADSLEDAANGMVDVLYDACRDPKTGERSCALVRFYITHDYGSLPAGEKDFARKLLGGQRASEGMKCLTLLATAGEREQWNSRKKSVGHRAIPLAGIEIVDKAPMVGQLFTQFGIEISDLLRPSSRLISGPEGKSFNVFHVEKAVGSPFIPAQNDFVVPERIRSVVGFGGELRSGELFALILFSRAPIPPASAERFESLAVAAKSAIFLLAEERTWAR